MTLTQALSSQLGIDSTQFVVSNIRGGSIVVDIYLANSMVLGQLEVLVTSSQLNITFRGVMLYAEPSSFYTGQITTTASPTTPAASASSLDHHSKYMAIVPAAAGVVLIIAIIAYVAYRKKRNRISFSAARQAGVTNYNNPLYDAPGFGDSDSTGEYSEAPFGSAAPSNYAEPMNVDTDTAASTPYIDVEA
jgi:hypothetical protein